MSPDQHNECYVCEQAAQVVANDTVLDVNCERCGSYRITSAARYMDFGDRSRLSAVIRTRSDRGTLVFLGTGRLDDILESVPAPRDPMDSLDLLLEYVKRRTARPLQLVHLNNNTDYPVVFGSGPDDFRAHLELAEGRGLLSHDDRRGTGYFLTPDGWTHLEQRGRGVDSDQAFVAMWFDPEMDEAFEEGFNRALDSVGYRVQRIDRKAHLNRIDDEIIAEIRRSRLVVADFTGDRGGVYFEAGFGMGLGVPVIFACREDWFDKLHFDTRQYPHIKWTDPDDLCSQLEKKLEALGLSRVRNR